MDGEPWGGKIKTGKGGTVEEEKLIGEGSEGRQNTFSTTSRLRGQNKNDGGMK